MLGLFEKKIIEFSPEIYPYTFWISEENLDILNKKFSVYYDDTDYGELVNPNKTTLLRVTHVREKETGRIGSLLRVVRKDITHGSIGHEAVHMANNLYKHIGKEVDTDNDEDYAYLIGWIIDKIYKNGKRIFNL